MTNWVKTLSFCWIVLHMSKVSIAATLFDEKHEIHVRSVEGAVCTTTDNKQGVCVEHSRCKKIMNLEIQDKIERTPYSVELLRNSRCGWRDNVPKVCCSEIVSENPPSIESSSDSRSNIQPTITESKPINCGKTDLIANSVKIIGGSPAELGSWPWMVALGYRKWSDPSITFRCGASLISDQWLLTAAHCVVGTSPFELTSARLGDLDLDAKIKDGASPVDMAIDKPIVHPKYSTDQRNFDVALIRLKEKVVFTNLILPICVLSGPEYESDNYYKHKKPYVIGWGVTENGNSKTRLYQVSVNVVDLDKCKNQYKEYNSRSFTDNIICAGEPGKDACQGDSGGPLMFVNNTEFKFYLGGIVSGGKDCGKEYSGLYIRVAKFIDWISDQTKLTFK